MKIIMIIFMISPTSMTSQKSEFDTAEACALAYNEIQEDINRLSMQSIHIAGGCYPQSFDTKSFVENEKKP